VRGANSRGGTKRPPASGPGLCYVCGGESDVFPSALFGPKGHTSAVYRLLRWVFVFLTV